MRGPRTASFQEGTPRTSGPSTGCRTRSVWHMGSTAPGEFLPRSTLVSCQVAVVRTKLLTPVGGDRETESTAGIVGARGRVAPHPWATPARFRTVLSASARYRRAGRPRSSTTGVPPSSTTSVLAQAPPPSNFLAKPTRARSWRCSCASERIRVASPDRRAPWTTAPKTILEKLQTLWWLQNMPMV
eukprot:9226355-Pyramimonas_sp.AAC.1